MSVFGFFNVKAVYYPWFLLTYHLIMGNGLNIFYIMGFVGMPSTLHPLIMCNGPTCSQHGL